KKDYPFLKEVDSLALANVQLHLQAAYKNFFTVKVQSTLNSRAKRQHALPIPPTTRKVLFPLISKMALSTCPKRAM
ncbi:MAG: hypothetical protein II468_04885, partial [Lachnospiraceae bacterium]|nr:hypothetical protein [Lachnospiraceae bacterium]